MMSHVWAGGRSFGHGVALVACLSGCVPMDDLSSYSSRRTPPTPGDAPRGDAVGNDSETNPVVLAGTPEVDAALPGADPRPADAGADADASAGVDASTSPSGDGGAGEPEMSALAAAPPLDASAVGPSLPGALVGASQQSLTVAGLERRFIHYAPVGLDPNVPAPVLIVAHGFGQTAADLFDITRFDLIAEREGFVVLYPDGQGRVPWNIGADVCPAIASSVSSAPGDDSAFVDAMLAFVAEDRRVDGAHVFVAGLASGGYFANELGCRRSDIRAIVSHSGGSHALTECASAGTPVLLLHGLDDGTIASTCSEQARERWVEHNGCGAGTRALEVLGGSCELALDCPPGGQVELCTFEGMGQGWAGGSAQDPSFSSFASASELSWEFFTTNAW